ncbi:NAD kinase NadK [Gottschalkia purinilytica]|uniref:NAD kinase n=1 Tax=Gottschalkia purinilytica TaxID=1503 RepID=A0A0L0WDF2_GOTPU|nr:NAD(+)/NADH kinase [Gottschalkia purinilytica]KNF09509.1 NAD kinase NadK [Gottschalkia purinilytica]
MCGDCNKKSIINIIHNNDSRSKETYETLESKLKSKGFFVSETFDESAMLNICIGGDGAFLRAVHKYNFPDTPFIGVNTGHLGFFQEVSPDNLDSFVNNLYEEKYKIEEFKLIEAIICTRNSCIVLRGINEIALKGIESQVIHLNISIDNEHFEKVSGDGIIVSTPIGSTAYNFSCGGSIINPSLKTLQLTPIAPINSKAYRSLQSSLIIPSDSYIKVTPEYRDESSILIIVDGKQFQYDNIIEINFQYSNKVLRKLTINEKTFWSNVRDKFL